MKTIKNINQVILVSMLILLSLFTYSSCKNDEPNKTIFKITVISNGGTNIAPIFVSSGELLPQSKLYPNPIVTDGGKFVSWCTDAALQTEFDFNTPITKDMTLYAKWFYTTYTVSFVMNGAAPIDNILVKEGKYLEVPKPVLDGSVFVNWYENQELTLLFDAGKPITSDKTLYARWEKNSPSSWFVIDGSGVLTSCTPPDGTKTVVIPEGVKAIPAWFVLVNGLNAPGKPGFPNGKNIQEFILPESLQTIGEGAFKFAGINAVNIPAAIKVLEPASFEGCSNLISFTFSPNSQLIRVKGTPNNDCVIGAPLLESIVFPPSLQYIGMYTLKDCSTLKSLTFQRSESPVIFDPFLPGGGVWLFNGYFPAKIKVPNSIKVAFIAEMRKTMQDYEFEKMSGIVEGY